MILKAPIVSSAVLGLTCAAAYASFFTPSFVAQETATVEAPAKTNLERALNTISEEEIRADLMYIASDELGGRDSPSPQLKVAARFIEKRLKKLGFKPGAQEGSFFYEWQIHQIAFKAEETTMTLTAGEAEPLKFTFGEDYLFPSWRAMGMRELQSGDVIFGGDMGKDTLAELEVEGKWIISVEGKGLSGRNQRAISKKGALGVIVLPDPDAEKSVMERYGRMIDRLKRPQITFDPSKGGKGFPLIHLTEDAARQLPDFDVSKAKPGDSIGWTVAEQCSYGDQGEITLENVVGIWPGSDPELKKEVIILSAHYDHVGQREDGTIFNGADDNGSGTCGMLAIAEALKEYGPMRRSVMLMWVSAEEKGLLGSEAWTKDPYLPDDLKPLCNINIDMIGRNASDEFLITPTSKHKAYSALTKVAEVNAKSEGFNKIKSADDYWSRSDHANFERHMNLPVAFLFCDVHEDYHKATDTPDKINYDKMRRICRLVVRMLEALQIDKPKF